MDWFSVAEAASCRLVIGIILPVDIAKDLNNRIYRREDLRFCKALVVLKLFNGRKVIFTDNLYILCVF